MFVVLTFGGAKKERLVLCFPEAVIKENPVWRGERRKVNNKRNMANDTFMTNAPWGPLRRNI